MIKLKIIKILTKRQRKQIKNKKGANWNKYYYYWKKIINFIWRIKLKTITIIIIEIIKIINLLRLKTIKNHKLWFQENIWSTIINSVDYELK
jgi:hypothetical protein